MIFVDPQVFLPFYLINEIRLNREAISIIPLIIYLTGFLGALSIKKLNVKLGRKITYAIGSLLVAICFLICQFITSSQWAWIYPAALILGFGNAAIVVCSVQLQADLVGTDINGGLVYGIQGFVEKTANGIAIFSLQAYNYPGAGMRQAVATFPLLCLGVSLLVLFTINIDEFKANSPQGKQHYRLRIEKTTLAFSTTCPKVQEEDFECDQLTVDDPPVTEFHKAAGQVI